MRKIVVLGAAAVALYAGTSNHGVPVASSTARASGAAGTAISYARQQLGKPYIWGGTGPDGYDCSGLVMMAYQSAGVSVPRTSQDQWASVSEPHVSTPEPGDVVFFAGSDGTRSAPGHEGLVIGPNQMIEAYATGYSIRVSTFGLPTSPPGDQDPVGFTDPAASGKAA